jgi:hypothetical protein
MRGRESAGLAGWKCMDESGEAGFCGFGGQRARDANFLTLNRLYTLDLNVYFCYEAIDAHV